MELTRHDGGPTSQELEYLKSLKNIFPGNYKRAMSELNRTKGVKKKELVEFLTSVYDLDEKVARATLTRHSLRGHSRNVASHKRRATNNRRGKRQSRNSSSRKKKSSKVKRRAMERIEELCGISGDSDGCKKKKRDECKKADPCKKKYRCSKKQPSTKKRKSRCSKRSRSTSETSSDSTIPEKRVKREWKPTPKEPSKENPDEPSTGPSAGNSNQKDTMEEKEGEKNTTDDSNPESQQQNPFYIS